MCGVKLREYGNQTENEKFERIRMCRNIWEVWSIRYNIWWQKYISIYVFCLWKSWQYEDVWNEYSMQKYIWYLK